MSGSAPAGPSVPSGRARWALFWLLVGGVAVADQLSKRYVDAAFGLASASGVPPTPIIGDFVRIAKSYNSGGLFGLLGSSAGLLALASLLVMALLVRYQAKAGPRGPLLLTVALGLLLGGAVGNLIDRLQFGYVIDYVDMGLGAVRWYTFNVADAAISVAIVTLLLLGLLERPAGRRTAAPPAPPRAADGAAGEGR